MEPKLFVAMKAFIVHDGKVLILRESSKYTDATNVAHYDVVGGRIVPGQHYAEALKREILEETGLTVEIGRPFAVNEWRPTVKGVPWQIIGTFFECSSTSDAVKLSEDHDDYQWIVPTKYKEYSVIENLYPVFKAYLALKK
jgi:8-oxo-dGTP diphosphatase